MPLGGFDTRAVSTHSRPKAAGAYGTYRRKTESCFNTQPPEGGWVGLQRPYRANGGFNTQPPEGGW